MFITSKNKYLSNDMKIFGTCSIPLNKIKLKTKSFRKFQNFYIKLTIYILRDSLQRHSILQLAREARSMF